MGTLASTQYVSSFALLKALGSQAALASAGVTSPEAHQLKVSNGMHRIVQNIVNADLADPLVVSSNFFSLKNRYYVFELGRTDTALEPAITADANGTGRYIMLNDPVIFQRAVPADAPTINSCDYYAELINPARFVRWRSRAKLPATPTVADWIGDTNPIEVPLTAAGDLTSFNADFVGQKIKSNDAYLPGIVLEAVDQSGTWKASIEDNDGLVLGDAGTDINGNETISASSGGFLRRALASADLTLPDLSDNIEFAIPKYIAIAGGATSLNLIADVGATINGGASVSIPGEGFITIRNSGSSWFANIS